MLELLINKQDNLKTIMLVENGILVEKHEEHEKQKRLEGNIYLGKVVNVLKGMQAAFIDIGEVRHSLIKVQDILPKVDITKEKQQEKPIEDVLKEGEKIVIQIKKDGTASKGAKVSTHINLSGRFAVLMPDTKIITVSQKIENEGKRKELIEIAKKVLPANTGVILRTSSENATEEEIQKDIQELEEKWIKIREKATKTQKAPELLYDNMALIRRTAIDIIDRGLERIIVNDKKIYEDVKKMLNDMKNVKIELIEENLFNIYSLSSQIEKMENRKIWLKCGGFITIDRTEALTAIDVNTGKYTGKKNLEETIYKVNQEATVEIARQLRLRDIGGIIIIDYIDMHKDENKELIEKLLKEQLKKDRAKTQAVGFTKLNLFEMTRKNMCNNEYFEE